MFCEVATTPNGMGLIDDHGRTESVQNLWECSASDHVSTFMTLQLEQQKWYLVSLFFFAFEERCVAQKYKFQQKHFLKEICTSMKYTADKMIYFYQHVSSSRFAHSASKKCRASASLKRLKTQPVLDFDSRF